jgi:hypothetical protein
MDLTASLIFGQLVNAAYANQPSDLTNRAGQTVTAWPGGADKAYDIITTIYANDLATEMNPLRATSVVSIGLVLQGTMTGNAVVAIRGTEGIMEWMQDSRFLAVPCPFLSSAGNTEDGFTAMYGSLCSATGAGAPSLVSTLPALPWTKPVGTLTICGHSLGGALAVLLALDIAANGKAPLNNPTVYTYASPRAGDTTFVSVYNHVVPNTTRIVNRLDLVPNLPTPPIYGDISGLFELNPIQFGIPPKVLVKYDLRCEHVMNTYLYLLSTVAGGTIVPLAAQCAP